jgi:hypothetical protein
MTGAVVGGALALAALNLITCLIGALSWYGSDSTQRALARPFWAALRVGQAAAVAFALGVGVLAAGGHTSGDGLFYLYALLPLAIAFVAEQLRVASAQTILDRHGLDDAQSVGSLPDGEQLEIVAAIVRRELGVMTLSALVVAFLALRAASTAHF